MNAVTLKIHGLGHISFMRKNRSPHEPTTKEFLLANIKEVNGCWEWQRARNTSGYGAVWYKGKVRPVHRVAYELWNGEFESELLICHKCDNPPCINPEHLFKGTDRDNSADSVSKGRNKWPTYHGTESPVSKLTEEQVRCIRASTVGARKIAPSFGVCATTIKDVRNGKKYATVV